jgi:hypothetical protein
MRNDLYLPPRLLQTIGVALLIGSAVFWAITGRESLVLLSSAMSLIGLGAYAGAAQTLRTTVRPAPPEERVP